MAFVNARSLIEFTILYIVEIRGLNFDSMLLWILNHAKFGILGSETNITRL